MELFLELALNLSNVGSCIQQGNAADHKWGGGSGGNRGGRGTGSEREMRNAT